MRYYETLLEQSREGLTIIVDKTHEDIDPWELLSECFDDRQELYRKIDQGYYDWFMLRVRVMYMQHELAAEFLGGCLYENAAECLTDGVADDLIFSALHTARGAIPELIEGLQKIPLEA